MDWLEKSFSNPFLVFILVFTTNFFKAFFSVRFFSRQSFNHFFSGLLSVKLNFSSVFNGALVVKF
ncbi:hypothetical protein HMPREF1425_00216 [Helicobacter pylori GAM71Ai]|nr:hypothetical protein HMPREF1420_00941 [Helicobacter pylori GAM264Ai]EMH37395.1 hypothetical protein HMPREF1425_00216 [Helicobacter pylori GAM71Ai]EMH43963.1 hypothetical protein HMPREF1431_00403 [Helicobacter pylori GAMchJs106B]